MKLKKIMLAACILLAILTICSVSANEDVDFNETLSEDVSLEDSSIQSDVLGEGEINEDNFDYWLSSHESITKSDDEICWVNFNDVDSGYINFTIENPDGGYSDYSKDVDGDEISWTLNDLELSDLGFYRFNLSYVHGENQLFLAENHDFQLTQFDYEVYDDDSIFKDYPFDVIRVWSEDIDVEVRVDNVLCDNGGENPFRWTLSDLNIDGVGDYEIVIKANRDNFEEEFRFVLNVDDDADYFRLISNNLGVRMWDCDGPILYLISPNDKIGENVTFIINDVESELNITSPLMNWTLEDLGIEEDDGFEIKILYYDEEVARTYFNVGCNDLIYFEVGDEDEIFYLDNPGYIVHIYCPEDMSGKLSLFVDNAEKFRTNIYSDKVYEWDLKSLGITEEGYYNVTFKFQSDNGRTINREYYFNVREFENDTFRAKVVDVEERKSLYFFSPADKIGTITLTFKNWNEDNDDFDYVDTVILELNETHWNRWTCLSGMLGGNVEVKVNDTDILVEYPWGNDGENWYEISDNEIYPGDVAIWVYVSNIDNNYTINVTSGNYTFFKKVSELGEYDEWCNGNYLYPITIDDLDLLRTLNDKDKVFIFFDADDSFNRSSWIPYQTYTIEKTENYSKFYDYWDLRIDLIKIELVGFELTGGGFVPGDYEKEDVPQEEIKFVRITVPDSLNITETGNVHITYGNQYLTKQLSDLVYEYNYQCLGKDYYVLLGDLNLANLKDKDVVNVSVTSNDEILGSNRFVMHLTDEGWEFDYYQDSIDLIFYYGQIGDLEYGVDGDPDAIIELTIPEYLNINEGTIIITDENGEVIFSKSLSEFEDEYKSYDGYQSYSYWISDNVTEFDYSCFKQNVSFTVSFSYGNNTIMFAKGIRIGDKLFRINTPRDVENYFKITISDNVLINDTDNVIVIEATDRANRQSIVIGLGSGYFVVYVNDVKVEDLGRLIRVENETELELFRLHGGSVGSTKLYIYLSDLNVTENGIYNIRIAHHSEDYDDGTAAPNSETEVFNKNITLTSNVKVENATSDVLTGFGIDPILLYLDTYYGEIDDVTGNVTVLNSAGEAIFEGDIRSLSSENGRYYLKYSDFKDKNFGDKITVMYEGNERSANTTVDVLWKDVDSTDFAPAVNDDVNDYYGDFINLNIPDLLSEGQIIVTLKFKGNHSTNLPNMNVTSDFGSQAIYRFGVADIKANYAGGFKLSLSDLGFYEDDGDYEVDVKFTADGVDILDITNNTLKVAFSDDILITIDETTRYAFEQEFARVRVFEPTNAYVDLYVDGNLFAHMTSFEEGLIKFISSKSWAPGMHTAEIRVVQSEFERLLNSSAVTFEVLTQTRDVDVAVGDNVKENEHVSVNITVPKEGNVTIDDVRYELHVGLNIIDLGKLSYGNHTMWVLYEVQLDDGGISFYNNYVSVFVGDDGHWLDVPDPLVLGDDDTIKMNLGEGATGSVSVEIDGKPVGSVDLVNGCAVFKLTDYITGASKYGMHSYNVIYSGDANHDRLSRNGTFYATYIFKDDIIAEGYPLKDSYVVTVTLPDDATGTVHLLVDGGNGQDFESTVKDGKAVFTITDLTMGEHLLVFIYSGDSNYPRDDYATVLNVNYFAVVGEVSGDKRYVSLMLPSNATGNLTVYNDNRMSVLASVPIVDGKAAIDLSSVPVGIYEIRAYYDGDDYDVKSFSATFRVMPKVNITQDIVMGDNGNIFMDLDNATGDILIAMDGLDPKVLRIENGIVNYTFSTEGYSYGNHTVNFIYFGKSFDGYIFFEEDGRTQIDYPLHILPKDTTSEGQSNREVVTIYVRDNETGNIAWDAEGTVQFFIDGVEVAVVEVVNGIATLDISGFKEGEFVLSWIYSGDNKYGSSSNSLPLNVNHEVAKIIAKDTSVLYSAGNVYSVVVYNADGTVAGGVRVTFSIDNKFYQTANTDSNGVARVVITSSPGSYRIAANALGISVTKNLNVNHIISLKNAKVKKSAKKLVLQAKLMKVNGKYLKGKKITFKFNGKKYVAKTNKKGIAKATVKSKDLKKLKVGKKIQIQATYLKDTVKKTIKVKK
ncbi:Ig-like domain repeat protein [Methanobrevibacter sp.]|uniref:Ig-like domain repeat protein n=1 Tax=Methanobrevibacter sp. TaxID=66852 RepID=UPI0038646607